MFILVQIPNNVNHRSNIILRQGKGEYPAIDIAIVNDAFQVYKKKYEKNSENFVFAPLTEPDF